MYFIDTHTHLFLEEFDQDRKETIQKAIYAKVTKMILPNVDSQKSEILIQMAKDNAENIFPLMGLHPSSVKENYKDELSLVVENLKSHTFYGIGEIGIDLYWDKTFLQEQIEAFRFQINLAREYQMPIIIHVRDSFDETFEVLELELKEHGSLPKGIFHCFTGNLEQARRAIQLGFLLGIGGVLTFKNSGLDNVVKQLDLTDLVLETDSPFLAPAPFRGKRNESAYIPIIAQRLADIHEVSLEKVAQITTKNAELLFMI